MLASKRTRTVIHHEWPLASPAHVTDVSAAVNAAEREIQQLGRPADIWISSGDDEVVVGYSVEMPAARTAAEGAS